MNTRIQCLGNERQICSCIFRTFTLKVIFFITLGITSFTTFAQVGISTTSITPDASSILELRSTTLGFLPPRMTTTQRDAITSPATGLLIYNTTTNLLNYYTGSSWTVVSNGTGVSSVSVTTANGVSGSVANPTTTPAISLTLGAITPTSVAATGTVTGSNLSGTNTGDQTITLTGDITGSGTGSFATTIATDAVTTSNILNSNVTYAKIQNVSATNMVLGRSTAGAGVIEEIPTIGTGDVVRETSPTLITPILGVASATTINKVTITAPATGSTLTIANGKTLTANNSITLAGTDATTMTFPSVSSNMPLIKTGALTAGTTVAVDFSAANVYTLTPLQNETLNASGGIAGGYYSIIITTSGTTSRTLTFGTNFKTTATLATGTVTAKVFVITFVSNGTTFYEVSRTIAM